MSVAARKFKLVFFSPKDSTHFILDHLFTQFPQTLGKIGEYENCAFITRGTGQFKPGARATPTTGTVGQLELVEEDRVEVVIADRGHNEEVEGAVKELKNVHPYEEVAYDVYKLENF